MPILNPDGVIVGNTRCSLAGRDLNRQYKSVIKEAFPPVYHIKTLIRRLMEEGSVVFYCDMHAHSRYAISYFRWIFLSLRKICSLYFWERISKYTTLIEYSIASLMSLAMLEMPWLSSYFVENSTYSYMAVRIDGIATSF